MEGTQLFHTNLAGALLSHANLRDAQLHDANMTSAWANNANLQNAALYRANLTAADLRFCDLSGARLDDATLRNATLWRAVLVQAKLYHADLQYADCWRANFEGADLSGAKLQCANLRGCILREVSFGILIRENELYVVAQLENARLDEAIWGPEYVGPEERRGKYEAAGSVYRNLKEAHQRLGLYDISDEFAYREQVVGRKQALLNKDWPALISRWLAEVLFGYGYRWKRVVIAALAIFMLFACTYWVGCLFGRRGLAEFGKSLYFSAVSFSGVGYGPWIVDSPSPLKYLGALEAPCGVFLMALFLVTFTRRYVR